MFAYERRSQIAELINHTGSITVQELMKMYQISIETVRKDLSYLEDAHLIKRVHGGAVALSKMRVFKHLDERIDEHKNRKIALAKTAMSLVCENDIIALDSGSTAIEFVPFLRSLPFFVTIITHSIDVFSILKDDVLHQTILIGGQYLREEGAFYGQLTIDNIANLHFSKAFICPSAVSLQNGISDYESQLVMVQKAYIAHSDQVIALADSSKFEKNAFLKLCDINLPKAIVTDDRLDNSIYDLYKNNNINILKQGDSHAR